MLAGFLRNGRTSESEIFFIGFRVELYFFAVNLQRECMRRSERVYVPVAGEFDLKW